MKLTPIGLGCVALLSFGLSLVQVGAEEVPTAPLIQSVATSQNYSADKKGNQTLPQETESLKERQRVARRHRYTNAQTFDTISSTQSFAENWKGRLPRYEFDISALVGMGLIDDSAGFALMGALAKKIMHQGWVPDINNQLFIEAELGAVLLEDSAFAYSLHLRWDFGFNEDWRFFALGGLGGAATGPSQGDNFRIHPRFGVGAFYRLSEEFSLRMEASHELVGVGGSFRF